MAMLNFGVLPIKTAAEKKDYSFDWSKELAKDGDTIAAGAGSSLWSFAEGTPPTTPTISSSPAKSHDDQTTTCWIDASSPVGTWTLVNTIVTQAGRILVASATLKVVA